MLDEADERKRASLAAALWRKDSVAVMEFLLAMLSSEPSASVRLSIVDSVGRNSNPRIRQELARVAASDPDVRVSLLALERAHPTGSGWPGVLMKRLEGLLGA